MAEETHWEGVENTIEDPEEERVIFKALDSFLQYAKITHFNCTHQRRQAFYALPEAHWKRLAAPPFNYLETLDKVDKAIDSNADLGKAIVKAGLPAFLSVEQTTPGQEHVLPPQWAGQAKYQDVEKARSTIRQFYRDWSAEGVRERDACYSPVIKTLLDERSRRQGPDQQQQLPPRLKVLVPGAGLGRLVFELCRNGFEAEGNEISYHQLLASSYILNFCTAVGHHTIYPWVHTFSNHRSRANHLRGYPIPDIHCAAELTRAEQDNGFIGSMGMVAADFLCLYSDKDHAETYDAVASVFFLDTAPNLIRYLETIHHCLKPGGLLINNGPLLWHFENNAPGSRDADGETDTTGIADPGSFELTDDEVMALVEQVGFVIERREMDCYAPYIHDTESMLSTTYRSSFWVARKPETCVKET
ncbi:methyltransferase family [Rhypophila sp. PSN 637]